MTRALKTRPGRTREPSAETYVTHTLRGAGHDASEDGSARGTPLVADTLLAGASGHSPAPPGAGVPIIPIQNIRTSTRSRAGRQGDGIGDSGAPMFTLDTRGDHAVAFDLAQVTSDENRSNPQPGGPSPTLNTTSASRVAIAFGSRGDAQDAGEVAPPLRAGGHPNSAMNGGMGPAVAFANTAGDTALGLSLPGVPPVTTRNGDPGNVLFPTGGVRRLTPRECERLQGFPDDFTLIPVARVSRKRLTSPRANEAYVERGGEVWRLASDAARYEALGNSMAVPVLTWIFRRLEHADAALRTTA